MKKSIIFLFIFWVIVGCGSNNETKHSNLQNTNNIVTNSVTKTENMVIAKDNLLRDVVKTFDNYKIRVLTDKKIDEDSISKDTISVYGTIDGKNTKSILKLNSNYPKGTKIIVEVINAKDNKVIAKSKAKIIDKSVINFGSITINK